ncbi:hypothetical protein E5288_WYG019897 [Bos mutus]|uniref:Uncharacterized protein n=1 Tax=Bos mutus TaxID=72004 RepID=A0A6B0RWN4_9CETA|nr:hypothetical protein [Bos mutus]
MRGLEAAAKPLGSSAAMYTLLPPYLWVKIPEQLLEDRTHGEMIPHEEPGSPTEIKCDFPFIRLKPEPVRQ